MSLPIPIQHIIYKKENDNKYLFYYYIKLLKLNNWNKCIS